MNKGQRTAHRILDAAEAQFAQKGIGAASLRDIAAMAEIQQPGLYKHFASKEDLYQQVYERALRPLTELMDQILAGPADMPILYALTDQMTDLLADHPNIPRLLIRAVISRDSDPDEIALGWLARLVDYGRRLNATLGVQNDDEKLVALQIVAIFNTLFGFFWSSPLIETLTGQASVDPNLMELQKQILRRFVMGFDKQPMAGG